MINIQTIEFETKLSEAELLSKLNWQTYPKDNLVFAKTNALFLDTNKRFAGKINTDLKKFTVTRIRSIIYYMFPQIIVDGNLTSGSNSIKLKLNFKLSFYTFLFALAIVYLMLSVIFEMVDKVDSFDEVLNLIGSILLLPFCFLIGVYIEVNKTKKKIFEILSLS